ncbi:urate hydroxylase PuuD [Stutzerimonas tarimensis]|uniref:Urate hydroxylase PuuD n=1 Tax=Stutzerimonas tarimensis TaxID=1507735 RepID=A0ABV7T2W4_9GAMM
MEAHLTEWLNLTIRWIHLIVGIAWIGASFYFVWLENHLDRRNPEAGLSGDLWAIHGGGIYHLRKYKLAPEKMPETLHWFKWEAYATWLSGVALLTVVYYLNPGLYLVAPGSDLAPAAAVLIGLGSLLAGWFVYDGLCNSPLGKRPALLAAALFLLSVAAAWGYSQIFSGRAAYIHVGALLGTLMVGNVFRVIMPAQRALVAAIQANREPDPLLPARGLLRSRHNNYFTLPVLFIMISNHFPSTYGSAWNWAILAAISALAVLVRHYFNTRHDSHRFAWALPAAALGMICLAFVTSPQRASTPPTEPAAAQVGFVEARQLMDTHCTVCHAAKPTSPLFSSAPGGVMFDTPQQMQQMAHRIHAQAVATHAMPLGNITGMTQPERDRLGQWISQGAPIE